MSAAALMDVIGVTSIMPFLAVLAEPSMIGSNRLISLFYQLGRFSSVNHFLFALGVSAFLVLIVSAIIRSLALYSQNNFTGMRRHSLSCRLLEGYLSQPYEYFLIHHSSEMERNILSEVDQFIERALTPLTVLLSSAFVLVAMSIVLIAIDPISALIVALVLGTAYATIFVTIRPYLTKLGSERVRANQGRYESAAEALGGIKFLKLVGQERHYLDKFVFYSNMFSNNISVSNVLAQAPKFMIETIAFGRILLLALILMLRHGGTSTSALSTVLPLLGLYTLAGYRMLPAVQNIYHSMTQLRFAGPAIDALQTELTASAACIDLPVSSPTRLKYSDTLAFNNVTYHYPNSDNAGIKNITFSVKRGSHLGIVGATGAGKTTLVDVLLGLLSPSSGTISVDGNPITADTVRRWQATLGYVPQDIFLTDNTVAENIAFGIHANNINMKRVEDCARAAQIDAFIENELTLGYFTPVGERGVRLSGGQRQRIGIARALYRDPDIIVFDEATSALDTTTEKDVMHAIAELSGSKTVITITHRLSTVQTCDNLLILNNGQGVGFGPYSHLLASNEHLKRLHASGSVHPPLSMNK